MANQQSPPAGQSPPASQPEHPSGVLSGLLETTRAGYRTEGEAITLGAAVVEDIARSATTSGRSVVRPGVGTTRRGRRRGGLFD